MKKAMLDSLPEEKDLKSHRFEDDDAAKNYGNVDDTVDYFEDKGFNKALSDIKQKWK